MSIPFIKMHGTGNDFIVLDAREKLIELTPAKVAELANRRTGIGFDQCIVLRKSTEADVFMQIINADGSEVNACGNATRCVGWLIAKEENITEVRIETNAGVLVAEWLDTYADKKNEVSRPSEPSAAPHVSDSMSRSGGNLVRVNMSNPKFDWQEIPLSKEMNTEHVAINVDGMGEMHGTCVNMGNPHVVFFVDEHAEVDLEKIGPLIEHHSLFPERVNVSVAKLIKKREPVGEPALSATSCENQQILTKVIRLDVWERGAGITLSCGTAACATLVAAVKKDLVAPAKAGAYSQLNDINKRMDPRLRGDDIYQATIQLPGGDLFIEWEQSTGDVWMTGAVAESFRGEFLL